MDFLVTDGHILEESALYQMLVGGPIILGLVVMIIAFILAPVSTETIELARKNRRAEIVLGLGVAMIIASALFMFVDGLVWPTISAHV